MYLCVLSLFLFQDQPTVKENINISYRQIQVRVQNDDSSPLKGLKLEDFAITCNGKPLTPESFIEVELPLLTSKAASITSETEPAEAEGDEMDLDAAFAETEANHIVILLDPSIATQRGFQNIKDTAKKLVASMPAGTKASLYQMHFSLRTLTALTADRELLAKKIDEATYFPGLWNNLESLQKTINWEVDQANTPNFRREKRGDQPAGADVTIARLNILANMLKFKGVAKDSYANKVASSLSAIGKAIAPLPGNRAIYVLSGGGYSDDDNIGLLKAVTAELNWQNIAVHNLHFRDRETQDLNMVVASHLTTEDLRNMQLNLYKGSFVQKSRSINNLDEDEANLKTAPRTWSYETGGSFVSAFNPLQVEIQFERMQQGANHWYLISYKTDSKLDQIEINLVHGPKQANLIYGRTRGNYIPTLVKTENDKDRDFATTLVYGFPHKDTEITWTYGHFIRPDGTHVFPIQGRLDGPFPEEGYEIGMIALDENGTIIDERKAEIRKPSTKGELEFYDLLVTEKAPLAVRAMISEKKSGKSCLEEWSLQDGPSSGTSLSSLVLVPPSQHEVFAIHAINRDQVKLHKKKVAREKLDPLIKGPSKRIPPSSGPFIMGQPIGLFFHAQKMTGTIQDYDLEARLNVEEGTLRAPLQIVQVNPLEPDGAEFMVSLDTSKLDDGDYKLSIRLRDKRDGSYTAFSEQNFSIR